MERWCGEEPKSEQKEPRTGGPSEGGAGDWALVLAQPACRSGDSVHPGFLPWGPSCWSSGHGAGARSHSHPSALPTSTTLLPSRRV